MRALTTFQFSKSSTKAQLVEEFANNLNENILF